MMASPPDGGVIAIRHLVTGRASVVATQNLDGLLNRIEFARQTGAFSALPDPHIAADARDHGLDGVETEVLERVPVEPRTTREERDSNLETLAGLWRERLAGT